MNCWSERRIRTLGLFYFGDVSLCVDTCRRRFCPAFSIKSSFFFRGALNSRILSIFLRGNATSKLSATNGDLRVRFRQKHPYRGKLWCPYYLRALHRLLLTLLPSIFMTGVHPPSPHPKSPMWQRTDVGFESKIIVIIWVLFVLDKEDTF